MPNNNFKSRISNSRNSKSNNLKSRKSNKNFSRKARKAKEVLFFNSEEFNNKNTNIDINDFDTVLGSGGFGRIYQHKTKPIVSKFIYSKTSCAKGKLEYDIFNYIYNTLISFNCKTFPKQIYIPKPINYDNNVVHKNNISFSCSFTMEKINAIQPYNEMIHIILKKEYEKFTGKSVGRIYMKSVNLLTNPSRGFFASEANIETILKNNKQFAGELTSVNDIAYNLGYIYAFLVGVCKIFPRDVEYLLGIKNNLITVIVLDFGMCEKIMNETDEEIIEKIVDIALFDLYFPYKTEKLFEYFKNGIFSAMECLDDKYKKIMNKFIEKY
jgi:hypothetical protein